MGSNPTPGANSTTPVSPDDIFNLLWDCKKKGYKPSTIDGFRRSLRSIARNVSLLDSEAVLGFIAKKTVSEARKEVLSDHYGNYCKWKGFAYKRPFYTRVRRLPFLPLEAEVDSLIAGLTGKLSVFCQFVKETGARPGEA